MLFLRIQFESLSYRTVGERVGEDELDSGVAACACSGITDVGDQGFSLLYRYVGGVRG
jgi:hypothetical protein